MKLTHVRKLLVLSLVIFAAALSLRAEESKAEEARRLQSEIDALDARVADPLYLHQRSQIRQELFQKIRRLHDLKRELKDGNPSNSSKSEKTVFPEKKSTPVVQPRATPPPLSTVEKPKPTPAPAPAPLPVPVAEASEPSPAPVLEEPAPAPVAPPPPPVAPPLPSPVLPTQGAGLTIYSPEDLGIGKGTQQQLEEVARYLRMKELTDARREWNAYLAGEAENLQSQPARVEMLIQYIIRQAHVEIDSDLSAYAAQVDAAKKKAEPALVAQTQADFDRMLKQRQVLSQTVAKSIEFLRQIAKQTYP